MTKTDPLVLVMNDLDRKTWTSKFNVDPSNILNVNMVGSSITMDSLAKTLSYRDRWKANPVSTRPTAFTSTTQQRVQGAAGNYNDELWWIGHGNKNDFLSYKQTNTQKYWPIPITALAQLLISAQPKTIVLISCLTGNGAMQALATEMTRLNATGINLRAPTGSMPGSEISKTIETWAKTHNLPSLDTQTNT